MAIRVLVVDDSATARAVITEILKSAPGIEVVGVAADAYIARDKIVELKPDVICLDVEMPRMDGVTFLKKLMVHMPTPVVMVSSLTRKGAEVTLAALEAGAVDYVAKPHSNIYDGADEIKNELIEKVRIAAKANVKRKTVEEIQKIKYSPLSETTQKVIAIGASTGGTEALKEVLMRMPRNSPGVVIVQHMPEAFTNQFAKRLNDICEMSVKEAENGDHVGVGQVLLAPGGLHMVLRRSGARYYVEIGDGRSISGHKPSVDVLFGSVAKSAGKNAVGVILTGMGADGASGMLEMHNEGALTIAQDEKSCVVFGMPKVAIEKGGVDHIVPLEGVAQKIIELVQKI
ncbi:MAG: two-component system, chemotaxis family, protein-glutamate methylesterase/glutaminase [Campylobacterota bacterium]|nr:two-component system, chemotaxis family, protein-glutamate methylesterase/glutaminase [Campylobacterota bacterium]